MDYTKLQELYKKLKPEIDKKIKSFKNIWANANDDDFFAELCFCLLTPQSKAVNAWRAIQNLQKNNLLMNGTEPEIVKYLNIVRFKNNKAKYIVLARKISLKENIRNILREKKSDFEKREWLHKNIKGYGLKEASHFLRNIGFVYELSILDRHILKNLLRYNVIDEIPKTISKKKYFEIETKMIEFSGIIKIPLQYLDYIFWYSEAGSIFK